MKPEILAMVDATDKGEYAVDTLPHIFLASLHWRGDELWAGPIEVGWVADRVPRPGWRYGFANDARPIETVQTLAEARAALEAAAKKQIETWFQEQAK